MGKRPKVSVITIAYNQEAFIRQALESIAEQKTDFIFEILVSDDRSTDTTPAIIDELAKKYPSIIKPTLRKKNIGSLPNFVETLQRAQGEYIAICEGDDYWLDMGKLQKQVDFLESHEDCTICFHPAKVVFESGGEEDKIFPESANGFTVENLLRHNFIQTNSVMYRHQSYDNIPLDIMPGDWYMHLYHARLGKIGFLDEVMSVYRRHAGGLWWDQHKNPEKIWEKHGYKFLRLLHEIMVLYGDKPEYRKIINNHIAGSYEAISAVKPQSVSDSVAIKSIGVMPTEAWDYMKQLIHQVAEQKTHLEETLTRMHEIVESERRANRLLTDELQDIKTSKLWNAFLKTRSGIHNAKHPLSGVKSRTKSSKREE